MQVDADTMIGGDVQQRLRGRARAARVEMGRSSNDVRSGIQCRHQQRTLVLTAGPDDRPPAQRYHLDVDHVGHPAAYLGERLDAAQAVVRRRVGVAAYCGEAVGGEQAGRPLGPLDRVLDAQLLAGGDHCLHCTEQVAGAIRDALGEEGLVEVGVRLHRGRRQQVPVEVDRLITWVHGELADGVDAAVT